MLKDLGFGQLFRTKSRWAEGLKMKTAFFI